MICFKITGDSKRSILMKTTLSTKTISVFKAVILFVGISIGVDEHKAYAGNDHSTDTKAEMDEYMIEVKNSLLKDFKELNKQIDNHNPENANKILSTVMKVRILELEADVEKLGTERTIQIWKKRFSFTKKTKTKIETKILSLEKDMAKISKEYFVIQKLLTESEIEENETDNTKKINHKINSI